MRNTYRRQLSHESVTVPQMVRLFGEDASYRILSDCVQQRQASFTAVMDREAIEFHIVLEVEPILEPDAYYPNFVLVGDPR